MADDDEMRLHLEQLSDELESYQGPDRERAVELVGQLKDLLASEAPAPAQHEDLKERLEGAAVDFEVVHPRLTEALRRAADALAATGL